MEFDEYIYSPLVPNEGNEPFRVIQLGPAESTAQDEDLPLVCRILQYQLASPEPYDALSYEWGKPIFDRPIHVEIADGSTRFINITESLETALKALRKPHEPIAIFCDQICINQDDKVEKSHQVNLMGQIYSKCGTVRAWLGMGTPESDKYFDHVLRINQNTVVTDLYENSDSARLTRFRDDLIARTNGGDGSEECASLHGLLLAEGKLIPIEGMCDILGRGWMSRVWIIQEACLGPNVEFVCGSRSCSWDQFQAAQLLFNLAAMELSAQPSASSFSAAEFIRYAKAQDAASRFRKLVAARNTAQSKAAPTSSLYDLVRRYNVYQDESLNRTTNLSSKWKATNPLDCIYALMGLVHDHPKTSTNQSIKPDYDKSKMQVYTDFAQSIVKCDINVLLYAQPSERTDCESPKEMPLPSWIPDWSDKLRLPRSFLDFEKTPFHAGLRENKKPDEQLPHEVSGSTLSMSAIRVGKIEKVGKYALEPEYPDNVEQSDMLTGESVVGLFKEVSDFCESCAEKRSKSNLQTGRDLQSAVWLVPTGGWGLCFRDDLLGKDPLRPDHQGRPLLAQIHDQYFRRAEGRVKAREMIRGRPRHVPPANEHYHNPISSVMYSIVFSLSLFLGLFWGYYSKKAAHWYRRVKAYYLGQGSLDRFHIQWGLGRATDEENRYPYNSALWKNLGRKCFITEEGRVGLGPASMQDKDIVVVAVGAAVPFVLRPQPTAENSDNDQPLYSFVGEAYCHGVMHGELIEESSASEMQVFKII
jgi:hypothetical protein